MEGKSDKKLVKKGGLEFIPLREGETEEMYRLRPGQKHPGQRLLGFMVQEEVKPDGARRP
jgi:hypothetical protein